MLFGGVIVVVVVVDVNVSNWVAVFAVVVVVVDGICVEAKPFGRAMVGGELGCDACAGLPSGAVLTVAGGVLAGIDLTKPLCVV